MNILVAGRGVGIIDAEWVERLIGFDLATLSVRIEIAVAHIPVLVLRLAASTEARIS